MKYTVEIYCDNAAFEEEPAREIVRILRHVADKLAWEYVPPDVLFFNDLNGNRVGRAVYSEEERPTRRMRSPAFRAGWPTENAPVTASEEK